MEVIIQGIKVNGTDIEAVVKLKADLSERFGSRSNLGDEDLKYLIERKVAEILVEKMILERGPQIMEKITDNQIINSILLKSAGLLGGK